MNIARNTATLLLLSLAACSDGTGSTPNNDYAPALLAGVPGTDSWVSAINRSAQVTGSYTVNGVEHAYRLAGSRFDDLAPLGGGSRAAGFGINDDGWVAGSSWNSQGLERATLWRPGQPPLDLGSPADTRAVAVNAKGEVIITVGGDHYQQGFVNYRWTPAGGLRDLPLPPNAASARATAVNAGGVVAGAYMDHNFKVRPVVWSAANVPADLPLGDATWASIHGISDAGIVVGEVNRRDDHPAAAWVPAAGGTYQLKLLRLPAELANAEAVATHANARGEIVGVAGDVALYWPSVDAAPVRLAPPAGMTRAAANGITESGQIAGWSGSPATNTYQATIWRP